MAATRQAASNWKPPARSRATRCTSATCEASRERWKRTVYVDQTAQEHTIFFDDLMPVGETHTFKPVFAGIRSILFVVDATNTKMGDSGRIWIRKAALEK